MSLFSGQHNEPWYVKLNPEGTHIPVLCCDDKVIVEPSEIIDFISKQAEGAGKLTLCMLGNFSCFCCRLLTFQIYLFQKNYFRNTIRVSKMLDQDQDRHSVGPDLG